MRAREITIGLAWHSANAPNLGLGALTLGHLAILDDICAGRGIRPAYRVIGVADPEPAYVLRPDLAARGLRTRDYVRPVGGLAGALRGCDIVLDIGGGDSFTDLYGPDRFRRLWALKALTLALGRPLVLAPQTIGPFARPWARRAAVWAMARARLVATRDALSTAYLGEIGFRGTALEASDVALRLPHSPPAPRRGGPVRVGLNVSGLLFHSALAGRDRFGFALDYAALMRAVVARFAADAEVELHLVGHVLSERQAYEDDGRAAERLAAEFPAAVVAPRFADPSAAKSHIAGMDFFMGSRMHACIAALSAGVAVLPIAYSRKFAGLFATLGYTALADCRSDSEATVLARIEDAYAGRAELAAEARAATARGRDRLARYGDALAPLIEAAARPGTGAGAAGRTR